MTRYRAVTPSILDRLAKIAGESQVIHDNTLEMEKYSHDEVADRSGTRLPAVVIKPSNALETASVMKLANSEMIPVTPRGAGSGLSGGASPVMGGILLSTERMNRILEIDKSNMVAVLEPGVITNEFNTALEKEGLFFAGYPMSLEVCSIGGNVAENAGGGRALKYGVTGRYITGLEVVLPTGDLCTFGGKRVKDVTGYNMVQLMVGSEGTLGVFTKIFIRLMPLPAARVDLLVLFPDVRTAIDVVPRAMTEIGIMLTGVEFMDRLSMDVTYSYLGEENRHRDCGAILIIELDGNDPESVRAGGLDVGDFCMEHGALNAFMAESPAEREKIWRVRRRAADAFNAFGPEQSLEDIVVPVSSIPKVMPVLERLSDRYGVLIPCYGHAGDGNLHATVIKRPEDSPERWREILPQLLRDLYTAVREMGGTISGEHGIGYKRKSYLPLVLAEEEIEAMKQIKRALDPRCILNPGKIFDL